MWTGASTIESKRTIDQILSLSDQEERIKADDGKRRKASGEGP